MSQAVSQRFLNAQAADVNQVASKVQLVLGNYFNAAAYGTSVASNGDDLSGNYPASGAIDGDRTEINIGASASADDNIGKSSWRSVSAPSSGSPRLLTITLSQARDINRIKLYHLAANPLTSYDLEYYNGSSWVVFAATSDRVTGSQVSITTTGKLDTINFPDITATQWRLSIYGSTSGAANVVEIEAYRLLDITSRVKAIKQTRSRDYKLVNPMAAAMEIDCINTDRFFSVSHVPTTAEAAAGFVNQELQPGVGIIVQMGFMYYGAAPELVTVFTGEIDSITISPVTRDAVLQHRDVLKKIINNTADSSNIKFGLDISACMQYVLNRANISNYEMALDETGINLPVFFTDNTAMLDTIRDLAQAAGDTIFYIDELGIPTFKDFSSNIPNQNTYTSQIDWESGTLQNISTEGPYIDELAVPPQFIPSPASGSFSGSMDIVGSNLSLPSTSPYSGDSFDLGGGTLQTVVNGTEYWVAQPYSIPRAGTITSATFGGWTGTASALEIWGSAGGVPDNGQILYSHSATGNGTPQTITPNIHVAAGLYWVVVHIINTPTGPIRVNLIAGGASRGAVGSHSPNAWTSITSGGTTNLGVPSSISFTYDVVSSSGTWTSPWYDSGSIAVNLSPVVSDSASYPSGTSSTITLNGSDDGSTVVSTYSVNNLNGNQTFSVAQHRYWQLVVSAATTDNVNVPAIGGLYLLFGNSGTWTSPILDTGTNTNAYGSIMATTVLNGGTVTFSTRSSPNGVTWSPYAVVSASGQILSPVQRYLQTQVVITLGPGGVTPLILDITAGWVSGAGSIKYPLIASFVFQFDSQLLDVQQSLADNLGGDSSILNDIIVQAQPLVLTGATDSDPHGFTNTAWQGTVGTPPVDISATIPLAVTAGQVLTFTPYVSGGMDISFMSGANPQAAVVVFAGGASGSWTFSKIHPTLPVLTVTITGSGNITDLRIVGLTYQNASYLQTQEIIDATSIARYGDRQLSISNNWITSVAAAAAIAQIQLTNYKNPAAYIPSSKVRLCPSIQLGDRVTIVDSNLDLSADYIVVGNNHNLTAEKKNATIETDLVLLAIPAGS